MGITKSYGFRAGYEVNDNFILPKCIGVFEVSIESGIRFLASIDMCYDSNASNDFRRRYRNNAAKYNEMPLSMTEDEALSDLSNWCNINHLRVPDAGYIHKLGGGRWAEHIDGFSVSSSYLMQVMCDVCGIQYDSDSHRARSNGTTPPTPIWRRFSLAYTVIGPAYGHVEYSAPFGLPTGNRGMHIRFTFRKPTDGTKILLYVYDMSSLSLRNFVTSAVVGYDINYGARVIMHEPGGPHGMYDTVYDSDINEQNLESFNSSALYLRLAASLDMKSRRYERKFMGPDPHNTPPDPYGLLSGGITEYRGVNTAVYRDFGIDNQKVALFVHPYVNEWNDQHAGNENGWDYYPSFFTAFPPSERGTMYCTSLTLDLANGGPIIQQMPGHMFFADISQIDKRLKDKFNYDPRARFL